MSHPPVSRSYTLQKKLEPLIQKLIDDGTLISQDQEVNLGKGTGREYRADYLVTLPCKKCVDIEVDLTKQHNEKADDERDTWLILKADISTIRLNENEIRKPGAALEKLRSQLSRVQNGEKIEAGSTRSRKAVEWNNFDRTLPTVALYLAISGADRGGKYGSYYAAWTAELNKNNHNWEPKEEVRNKPNRNTRKLIFPQMSKTEALALLLIEALEDLPLQRSNLIVYSNTRGIAFKNPLHSAKDELLISHAKDLLETHNVRYWFTATTIQLKNSEPGTSYEILAECHNDANFFFEDIRSLQSDSDRKDIEDQTAERVAAIRMEHDEKRSAPTSPNPANKSKEASCPSKKSTTKNPSNKKLLPISKTVERIRKSIPNETTGLTAAKANKWLIAMGYLVRDNGSNCMPTEKGCDAGIVIQDRKRKGNEYSIALFPPDFQKMIAAHVADVIDQK